MDDSYLTAARRSLTSLAFVAPLLIVYEGAVLRSGSASYRGAADGWMALGLRAVGLADPWWPPILLVFSLLVVHAWERRPWSIRWTQLGGMTVESLVLAIILVGLGKGIDLGFHRLEDLPTLATPTTTPQVWPAIEFLGVGLYEEWLFRLLLMPVLFGLLRLVRAPRVVALTMALTGAALLFSLAHHFGSPGEAFSWYAFVFRWTAGIYFGWIFWERGYGVAVGTHAAYDVMVGCLGMRF